MGISHKRRVGANRVREEVATLRRKKKNVMRLRGRGYADEVRGRCYDDESKQDG